MVFTAQLLKMGFQVQKAKRVLWQHESKPVAMQTKEFAPSLSGND
jgi:hypothetical protein